MPATIVYEARESRFEDLESPRIVDRSDRVYPHRSQGYGSAFHGVDLGGEGLFLSHVQRRDGSVSARTYPPVAIERVLDAKIKPRQVFDLTRPVDQAPEAYRAMDEHRAIDALQRRPCKRTFE